MHQYTNLGTRWQLIWSDIAYQHKVSLFPLKRQQWTSQPAQQVQDNRVISIDIDDWGTEAQLSLTTWMVTPKPWKALVFCSASNTSWCGGFLGWKVLWQVASAGSVAIIRRRIIAFTTSGTRWSRRYHWKGLGDRRCGKISFFFHE